VHWEAYQFIGSVKALLPQYFVKKSVLEIGAYHVNESIRTLFTGCKYTGLDLTSGAGVDIVISGHEFKASNAFDVVISCECLEHNPFYHETFLNMIDNTAPGGLIVFTCATTDRPEHGTERTDPSQSPGTSVIGWDYYKNLIESDFDETVITAELSDHYFFTNPVSQDLYFVGIKKGEKIVEPKDLGPLKEQVALITQWSAVWRSYWHRVNNKELDRFELFNRFLHAFPIETFLSSALYWLIHDLQYNDIYRKELIQLLERYLFHHEKDNKIRCVRAVLLFHEQDLMNALFEYEKVLVQEPNNFYALHGQGLCLRKNGEVDKALASFRLALSIEPSAKWLENNINTILSLNPQLM
jgi:tetratricopeptide (TPR) repeat protein